MEGSEGGSRYLSNYGANEGYGSIRTKVSGRNLPPLIADSYVDEDDEVEEDEEEAANNGDGEGEMNGSVRQNGDYVNNDDGDDIDNDNNDDGNDDDDDDGGGGGGGEGYKRSDGFNMYKHPKKRKLKSLSSSFELAPRVPPPPILVAQTASAAKPGGRNTLTDWSEHETFILLDAWGERFVKRGRKSLRLEEWQEVAEKVSQGSKLERTDTQCRNRLDTLKKKYKKEKALMEQNKTANTKWVYFKKMNMLMAATPPQQTGLSCGVDSGEFVFMNSTAYLNHANGLDEMRDSPGNTNSQDRDDDDDDDSDLSPPKKSKYKGEKVNGGSFKLLADSINKFCEIYEKIEYGKRKQMVELEKMRMDFYKDLELQKKQIVDKARREVAKIREGDHEENDDSAENIRG